MAGGCNHVRCRRLEFTFGLSHTCIEFIRTLAGGGTSEYWNLQVDKEGDGGKMDIHTVTCFRPFAIDSLNLSSNRCVDCIVHAPLQVWAGRIHVPNQRTRTRLAATIRSNEHLSATRVPPRLPRRSLSLVPNTHQVSSYSL